MNFNDKIYQSYYITTANRGHSKTIDHYDRIANHWAKRLKKRLPQNRASVCLDLACGCGELVYMLEKKGYSNTFGVDISAEVLAEARMFVKGKLINADVIEYLKGQPEKTVNLITAFNLLEHLPKDEILDLLKEAGRVMAPGGCFIAMVPNAVSPFSGTTRYWDITHRLAFTQNNFYQMAQLAGLGNDIIFDEYGPMPHGVKSFARWGIWQFVRLLLKSYLYIETGSAKGGIYTMDMLVVINKTNGK